MNAANDIKYIGIRKMPRLFYYFLTALSVAHLATPAVRAEETTPEAEVVDHIPNQHLQQFFDALPEQMQKRIVAYRIKAAKVEAEVEAYKKQPLTGLPPASFKTAQRKRMKIEAQMASLRLEQKEIAKEYYDLLGEGWQPPNNSNIVRLLVAPKDSHPAT